MKIILYFGSYKIENRRLFRKITCIAAKHPKVTWWEWQERTYMKEFLNKTPWWVVLFAAFITGLVCSGLIVSLIGR